MIVGALKDCGLVDGGSDVKADVYVCRVLGRALEGQEVDAENAERAVRLARQLHSADPWQLDWPLWHFGQTYCHTTSPNCSGCPLAPHCAYAAKKRSETEVAPRH
jgi:adenine-specific DNA glycosylase